MPVRVSLRTVGVILALLLVAALLPVEGAVSKRVRLVQVLHRHGARTGLATHNHSQICTEAPCGYLTTAGITMLQKTGAFLRNRYNNDATVVDEPMLPSESYDLDVVYSRSTDVLRTLQSANAFLLGLFPNVSALFPAIHTQPDAFDWLLSSNVVPWLKFFYSYNKPLLHEVGNGPTDELYPDWTELTRIGAEIHSEGYCSDYTTRSDCARSLFDYAASKMAAGLLHEYPLLEANFEKLQKITRVVFDYEYHYDKSEELHLRQGGRGRPFVQELLKNIDDKVSGGNGYLLMHYSAHDTTLAPVWGTLGDRTDNGMLPLFAQVLLAELLEDVADGSLHVRVLRGHPGQSQASNYEFGWDPTWQLRCVDPAGNMYTATENTCPLADFRRLVAWSAPADARGLCYLDDDFVKIADCTNVTITAGAPGPALSSPCTYYRQRCPEFSCHNGCVLNSVSLQCVCRGFLNDREDPSAPATIANPTPSTTAPSQVGPSSNGVSGGAAAAIAMGTFCFGAIVAAVVTVLACAYHHRKAYVAVESGTA